MYTTRGPPRDALREAPSPVRSLPSQTATHGILTDVLIDVYSVNLPHGKLRSSFRWRLRRQRCRQWDTTQLLELKMDQPCLCWCRCRQGIDALSSYLLQLSLQDWEIYARNGTARMFRGHSDAFS